MWTDSVLSLFRQQLVELCVMMCRMALGDFSWEEGETVRSLPTALS
mgnify:CR=1 FL=1